MTTSTKQNLNQQQKRNNRFFSRHQTVQSSSRSPVAINLNPHKSQALATARRKREMCCCGVEPQSTHPSLISKPPTPVAGKTRMRRSGAFHQRTSSVHSKREQLACGVEPHSTQPSLISTPPTPVAGKARMGRSGAILITEQTACRQRVDRFLSTETACSKRKSLSLSASSKTRRNRTARPTQQSSLLSMKDKDRSSSSLRGRM